MILNCKFNKTITPGDSTTMLGLHEQLRFLRRNNHCIISSSIKATTSKTFLNFTLFCLFMNAHVRHSLTDYHEQDLQHLF